MLLVDLMLVVIDVSQEELILGRARHHGLVEAIHVGNWPSHLFKPVVGSHSRFSSH